MAINKNHEFEDLNGIKCAIVERNVSVDRVTFLKNLLQYNGYTVVVVEVNATPAKTTEGVTENETSQLPSLYTIGVTDVTFNVINAVFGRLLKTPDGHTVTLAYWQQKESVARDDVPYFSDNNC
ncbi:hypothetical protein [Hydrotalea sandarakina]|jgi:hypothetical protein|uniref:Uncharacterized protein n=1 Tax=Hydrotalea sandarakina TaxID=1004304 RepID=A0A2W7RSM3_9BACT|nr:hypothetical protein [Hydrotalea sandarakina]PZX61510.1 hypothetical protein LX80_02240 [Hydrotalea sandarakina]